MNRLILLLLFVILFSCKGDIKTIRPQKGLITESVYASGFIKSYNQYKVFPAVNGTIVEVLVKEGDLVDIGTPLYKIHNSTVDLNIRQAKINQEINSIDANALKLKDFELSIENARLKLMNDSVLYERQKKLWEQEIGSKLDLEQRELSLLNSRNNYMSALTRLNDFKTQLKLIEKQTKTGVSISENIASDFIVRSQIKGKVYSLLADAGEFASVQMPLAILGDPEEFIIEMLIDEYDIVKLELGQQVFIRMDSYKGKVFDARLTKILPIMNERSKSFTAEAAFKNRPDILYPNLTVEANILIKKKENALIIPRKLLVEDTYVINKKGEKIKVETGLKDYEKAEILSGISESDEIIEPGS